MSFNYVKILLAIITVMACSIALRAQQRHCPNFLDVGVSDPGPICPGTSLTITLTSQLIEDVKYRVAYDGAYIEHEYGGFGNLSFQLGYPDHTIGYDVYAVEGSCSQHVGGGSVTVGNSSSLFVSLQTSGNPSQVCASDGFTLTAVGGISGTSYTWHADRSINIQGFDSGQVHGESFSPDQSAVYWVTADAQGQCGAMSATSNSASVTITSRVFTPSIPQGTLERCKGSGTSSYTSTAGNATSYSWAVTGMGNSISSSGTVTWGANFTGMATVTVTAYGCGGSSTTRSVNVSTGYIAPAGLGGGGAGCPNSYFSITLTTSDYLEHDVFYTLLLNGVPVDGKYGHDASDHTVQQLTWSKNGRGRYTVVASGYGCDNVPMEGEAFIGDSNQTSVIATPSSDPGQVCDHSSFFITASGLEGTNYTWYRQEAPLDFQPSGAVFSPEESGTYYVNGTNNCGNLVTSDLVPVTLLQVSSPVISGPTTVCNGIGVTTTFTSEANHVLDYNWVISGAGTSTISESGSATWDQSFVGVAHLSVLANGCNDSHQWGNVDVAITPPPAVSFTPSGSLVLCSDCSEILVANDVSGYTYQWIKDGIAITGADQSTYTVDQEGLFSLRVSANNCESNAESEILVKYQSPNNFNYLKQEAILVQGKSTLSELSSLPVDQKQTAITYFDGLGRTMQSVGVQATPGKRDFIQPVVFDNFGRESRHYLPFFDEFSGEYRFNSKIIDPSTGAYAGVALPTYSISTDNIADDSKPYVETSFEASPLNRILKQNGPGNAWREHAVEKKYELNETQTVYQFVYDPSTGVINLPTGTDRWYAKDVLTLTTTIDEDLHEALEYVDTYGRVVCKKVFHEIVGGVKKYAQTYYVYDHLDNLVVVLPPEAVKELETQN